MQDWLQGKKIEDEYDEEVSQAEFWEMVERKQKEALSHAEECPTDNTFLIGGYSFIDREFS